MLNDRVMEFGDGLILISLHPASFKVVFRRESKNLEKFMLMSW